MSTETETAPPVMIQNLSVAYGDKPVLQGLSWRLEAGRVVGLLGRNGAGKTSLLEAMLNRTPFSGRHEAR